MRSYLAETVWLSVALATMTASADTIPYGDFVYGQGEQNWSNGGIGKQVALSNPGANNGSLEIHITHPAPGNPFSATLYALQVQAAGDAVYYVQARDLSGAGVGNAFGPFHLGNNWQFLGYYEMGPGGLLVTVLECPDGMSVGNLEYQTQFLPNPPPQPALFSVDGQPFPNETGNYNAGLLLAVTAPDAAWEYYLWDYVNIGPGEPFPANGYAVPEGESMVGVVARNPYTGEYSNYASYEVNVAGGDGPEPPTVTPASGSYNNSVNVEASAAVGDTLQISLDQSNWLTYADGFSELLTENKTIYFRATRDGEVSDVVERVYTVVVIPTITFDPPAGQVLQLPQQVTVYVDPPQQWRGIWTMANDYSHPTGAETLRNSGTVIYRNPAEYTRLAVRVMSPDGTETLASESGVYYVPSGPGSFYFQFSPDPAAGPITPGNADTVLTATLVGTPPAQWDGKIWRLSNTGGLPPVELEQSPTGTVTLATFPVGHPQTPGGVDVAETLVLFPFNYGDYPNSSGDSSWPVAWHVNAVTEPPPPPCVADPQNMGARKCPDADYDGIPDVAEEVFGAMQSTYGDPSTMFDSAVPMPDTIDNDGDFVPDRWELLKLLCSQGEPCQCTAEDFAEAWGQRGDPLVIIAASRANRSEFDADNNGVLDSDPKYCIFAGTQTPGGCCCPVNYGAILEASFNKQVPNLATPDRVLDPSQKKSQWGQKIKFASSGAEDLGKTRGSITLPFQVPGQSTLPINLYTSTSNGGFLAGPQNTLRLLVRGFLLMSVTIGFVWKSFLVLRQW